MPQADAIIPTYNDHSALPHAVASCLALPSIQRVIIIDDGSSPPADRASLQDDARITLIHQPNAGPSAARNRALDESTAPFAIFCDADDTLLPSAEQSLSLAEQSIAAAVVSGRIDAEQGKPDRPRPTPAEWQGKPIPDPDVVFTPIALFGTPGLIISRAVIDEPVRFDTNIKHAEDREFLRRVADVGPILVSPHPAVRYRLHPPDAHNLNAPAHLARRVRDFLYIVDKHNSPAAAPRFAQSARWLINQLAKTGADAQTWSLMTAAARQHNWPIPLKARLRRLLPSAR